MENRLRNKITYLSYVLSLLVVIQHSENIDNFNFQLKNEFFSKFIYNFEKLITMLTHIAVPSFFLISAFLFYKSFDMSKLKYKYKSRFKSLFIPYLIWNTVGFTYFALLTNIPFFASKVNMDKVSLSFGNIVYSILNTKYTPLWFVRDLMFFVLIAPVVYFILNRKYILVLTIISSFILTIILDLPFIDVVYWIPLYLIGAYLGKNYEKLNNRNLIINRSNVKIIISVSVLFIATWIGTYYFNNQVTLYLFKMISPFMVWIIADIFEYTKKPKKFMKISFFIYCTHFILLSTFQKLALIAFGNSNITVLSIYLITPIFIVGIITIIAHFLEKHCNKIWKICTGGRY